MPVEYPASAPALGARADRGQVRTGIGLAHADAVVALAAADARQVFVALGLGAVAQDLRAALPVGDPVRGYGRAGGKQFLDHDIARERSRLAAAVASRQGHAQPAATAEFAAEFGIGPHPRVGALQRRPILQDFGKKAADLLTQRLGVGWNAVIAECVRGHDSRWARGGRKPGGCGEYREATVLPTPRQRGPPRLGGR